MRSEPAECSCPWEFRSETTTSERFTASHAPTTPCVCVLGAAEHPSTRLGPCWLTARGKRGKQREEWISLPDRTPGNVRWRPLSTHCPPVLLAAKREMRWEQSRSTQTELTRECPGCWDTHTPTCSDSAGRDELPHKANANARQGSATPLKSAAWKSQRYRLDPAWHRRGCGTEWQTVGVSTVCYSLSKMLAKTEEWKKVSEEQRFGLELCKCGGLSPLYFRIHKYTRSPINIFP